MASTDRQPSPNTSPSPGSVLRLLERNPEAMNPDPLPGYVWLAMPGKVLHGDKRHLDFTEDQSEGPSA